MRGCQPYRTRGAAPQGGEYLDVVIFGACDHQVVVARRLVHCETHHRPDVATQLSHGLQPGCKGTGQLLLCAGAHPKGPPTQSLPQPWSAPEGLLPLGRVGTETPLSVILGEEGSLGVCQHLAAQPQSVPTSGCTAQAAAQRLQPSAHWAGRRTREKQGPAAHPTCPFPPAKPCPEHRQTSHPTAPMLLIPPWVP